MPLPDRDEQQGHRTIDRVTQILEEVVYSPGMTFSDLVKALGAAKSSVHGFVRGLLAKGWLYEDSGRFYLGPAAYGLTLASGHIRAGVITHSDLDALHEATGAAVFLGVKAGEHLIYVAEAGSDPITGFDARTNIRRTLLDTAGGKAMLAAIPDVERDSYLRRQQGSQPELVSRFLDEFADIRRTRLATNIRRSGRRFAIASVFHNGFGKPTASITLVGPSTELQHRADELGNLLIGRIGQFQQRTERAREAI